MRPQQVSRSQTKPQPAGRKDFQTVGEDPNLHLARQRVVAVTEGVGQRLAQGQSRYLQIGLSLQAAVDPNRMSQIPFAECNRPPHRQKRVAFQKFVVLEFFANLDAGHSHKATPKAREPTSEGLRTAE